MRRRGLPLLLLIMLAPRPAAAEELRPRWNAGASVIGVAQQLGELNVAGFGPHLEVSRRAGPIDLLAESTIARTIGDPQGTIVRAGLGVRIVPRSFSPDGSGRIEMFLDGGLALQAFHWDSGGRLRRPEVSFGGGWQFRAWLGSGEQRRRSQLIVRVGLRMTLARAYDPDTIDRVACLGTCPPRHPAHPLDGGFVALCLGATWGR